MKARLLLAALSALLTLPGIARTAPEAAADRPLQMRIDAVKSDPEEPRNHFNLGLEYYNRELFSQAAQSFEKALKAGRKNKEAHEAVDLDCCQILGQIGLMQKKFGDAVKWFEKGLEVKPGDPMCLYGRGQAYFEDKEFSDAKKALQEYLTATSGNPKGAERAPDALNLLGAMSMEKKKYDEAAGYFRQVITRYPKQSREAGANLAIVLLTQGDTFTRDRKHEEAARLYDEAVAAAPGNAETIKASALAHYRIGQGLKMDKDEQKRKSATDHYKIADRNFMRAVKITPGDFQSWYMAGLSQFELERYDDMFNSYKRAVEINPADSDARFNLAMALHRKQQYEEAFKQAEEAKRIKRDPEIDKLVNVIFDSWQGDLMAKGSDAMSADRVNEAVGYWKKVLEINPRHPDAQQLISQAEITKTQLIQDHLMRGDAAFKEGDTLVASNEWNAAAQLDPENEEIQKKLKKVSSAKRSEGARKQAEAAYAQKDYAGAMARVNEALKTDPGDKTAQALKARIVTAQSSGVKTVAAKARKLITAGKLLQARRELEAVREASAGNKEVGDLLISVSTRIENTVVEKKAQGAEAMRGGNKDAARKAFESVLALNPDDRDANEAIKQLTGKESKAKVSAEKIKMLNKKGIFAYMQNNLTEAEKAWQEAYDLDPDNAEIKRSLDRVRLKMKKSA
jgi:tetratricopeptide (TPR) repeat protein